MRFARSRPSSSSREGWTRSRGLKQVNDSLVEIRVVLIESRVGWIRSSLELGPVDAHARLSCENGASSFQVSGAPGLA